MSWGPSKAAATLSATRATRAEEVRRRDRPASPPDRTSRTRPVWSSSATHWQSMDAGSAATTSGRARQPLPPSSANSTPRHMPGDVRLHEHRRGRVVRPAARRWPPAWRRRRRRRWPPRWRRSPRRERRRSRPAADGRTTSGRAPSWEMMRQTWTAVAVSSDDQSAVSTTPGATGRPAARAAARLAALRPTRAASSAAGVSSAMTGAVVFMLHMRPGAHESYMEPAWIASHLVGDAVASPPWTTAEHARRRRRGRADRCRAAARRGGGDHRRADDAAARMGDRRRHRRVRPRLRGAAVDVLAAAGRRASWPATRPTPGPTIRR